MPDRRPLGFICKCGHRSLSELARWDQWYTDGEAWHETCTACARMYAVTLEAQEVQ